MRSAISSKRSARSASLKPILATLFLSATTPAWAGPPFLTDDPAPTDARHYEIYAFSDGAVSDDGTSGDIGVDFNYGAAKDLQLTATIPVSFEHPDSGLDKSGLSDIELAAKYRFLHQETSGWDVAVFPRIFLPSGSGPSGKRVSFLLPIWVGKDFGAWSTFGGGGCAINRGGDAKDYCLAGWALTRQASERVRLGGEIFHQTADAKDGEDSTIFGVGGTYDFSERWHALGYYGAELENPAENGRGQWYASVLLTF